MSGIDAEQESDSAMTAVTKFAAPLFIVDVALCGLAAMIFYV